MPISTIYTPEHYTGDGTTANLPFSWRILAKTDVLVLARDADDVVTTLELDTDYTIADADVDTADGGDVVLTTPATWDTQEIWVIRDTAKTQLTNIEEGSPFPAAVVTKVFDRLTMMIQELKYLSRKALKFANASTFVDVDVPDPEDSKFLTWLNGLLINSAVGIVTGVQAVTGSQGSVAVTFVDAQPDANYTVIFLNPDWQSTVVASSKLTTGFTATFGTQSPVAGGNLSYGVVR